MYYEDQIAKLEKGIIDTIKQGVEESKYGMITAFNKASGASGYFEVKNGALYFTRMTTGYPTSRAEKAFSLDVLATIADNICDEMGWERS